ncbi:uridine 5'-monophosphate synthase-like [Amphiura filiformis]|uniref:uridine 5'-monophosphate synthase-like n=1 Tax=Amphiura filiformis TaxID=82378 RepID=UPI003B22410B
MDRITKLVLRLYEVEAVKFGNFKLKSGIMSPVYFDLRVMVSYPDIMDETAELLWEIAEKNNVKSSVLCGVPYTALPLSTLMAVKQNKPMVIRRKEAKDYGTKKMIEGVFTAGDNCLIIEDVVTSGSSVWETVQSLDTVGLKVTDAVVLVDRGQGGSERLKNQGISLHSVITLPKILEILCEQGKLEESVVKETEKFIQENSFSAAAPTQQAAEKTSSGDNATSNEKKRARKCLCYSSRADICEHPLAKQLFNIMEQKKSNLAFSVDVTTCAELLKLADQVGPNICMLKTHVDILEDFNQDFVKSLQELAEKHNFLIFEDRKFADIGNTVKHQYNSGVYKISDWAHIVNAHTVPGSGVIKGLQEVGGSKGRACLLIGQMSSAGNLATGEYTSATVKMAEEHADFVIGFICTSTLTSDPKFIHMTPGVKLSQGGDGLGQQYLTPDEVIGNRGTDIIIVGRGIYKAADPAKAAQEYQTAGYAAYEKWIAS